MPIVVEVGRSVTNGWAVAADSVAPGVGTNGMSGRSELDGGESESEPRSSDGVGSVGGVESGVGVGLSDDEGDHDESHDDEDDPESELLEPSFDIDYPSVPAFSAVCNAHSTSGYPTIGNIGAYDRDFFGL